jgi:hypothetical protein
MYVFHELQRIVVPVLPLPDILSNWTYVSLGLADRPRRRKIQVSKYFPKWETS